MPSAVWSGDQMDKGAIADLDAAELPLGDLDDGEHGIEGDDLGNHGIGLQRLAGGHRNRADDAVDRGTDLGALALGFGHRKLGLSLAQIGEKLVLLVGGDDAALDQRQLGIEIGPAFAHHGGGFLDLGLACLIRENGKDISLPDPVAATDPEIDDRAGGPRNGARAIVGLGAA